MHLFRIEKSNFIAPDMIKITNNDYMHIKKSLRKDKGDYIFTTDGIHIYKCQIKSIEKDSLSAGIISKKQVSGPQKAKISLFAGLIKFSNFELILDYATQLGVVEIYPVITEYTQNRTVNTNKINRWEKIINEASKQSFNPVPPVLKDVVLFRDVLQRIGLNILLHPYAENNIKEVLSKEKPDRINIYIGPEAGFSEHEIKLAKENKIDIVKLPYNILRSETAVISLISNILFIL